MKLNLVDIIHKDNVIQAIRQLKVSLTSRHWMYYDHKCKKYTHMCAISSYIKANVKNNFSPSSGEPGDDQASCFEAAQLLGVSYESILGFIIGFDDEKMRDNTPSKEKIAGWTYGKELRNQLRSELVEIKY